MKNLWLLIVFSFLSTFAEGQSDKFVFLDLTKVLNDLYINKQNSIYYDSLDCRYFMFLDNTCYHKLKTIYPDRKEDFNRDSLRFAEPNPEWAIRKYSFEIDSIQEFFTKENLSKVKFHFSQCSPKNESEYHFSNYIYVNGKEKALLNVYGQSCGLTYRVTLKNKELTLDLLYSTEELPDFTTK